MGNKERYISLFARLGEKLDSFGNDTISRNVIHKASAENPWFSAGDIMFSVRAIRETMLREDILTKWLSAYDTDRVTEGRRVGVVMAGNIPLVGFFDMMCVLVCGYDCYVKPSSKDSVLIAYVISLLREIDPGVRIYTYDDSILCDAVIATGSDNTNRYFRERFSGIPALLRGSRYSVAFLEGTETDEQMRGLSMDIFLYNGMGCRNVSLLLVPEGYDVRSLAGRIKPYGTNPKYFNNYRQAKGLMSVQGRGFIDAGNFVIVEDRDFPPAVSVVNYSFYVDKTEAGKWLSENNAKIQTVVSCDNIFPRYAGFGRAQCPYPWDYSDGEDVIGFLISLK